MKIGTPTAVAAESPQRRKAQRRLPQTRERPSSPFHPRRQASIENPLSPSTRGETRSAFGVSVLNGDKRHAPRNTQSRRGGCDLRRPGGAPGGCGGRLQRASNAAVRPRCNDVQLTEALTEARDRIVRSPLYLHLSPGLSYHPRSHPAPFPRSCVHAYVRACVRAFKHMYQAGGAHTHGSIRVNARTRKLRENIRARARVCLSVYVYVRVRALRQILIKIISSKSISE